MKTHNLTQISLRNDPINRRMHGFSFRVSEDEIEVQDVISPLSLRQNSISSTPWMRKRVKNTRKLNWHLNGVWTVRILSKIQGQFFRHEELSFIERNIGRSRWMKRSIMIYDSGEASIDRNDGIYRIHLIYDEASRCVDEEACLLIRPLDFDPRIAIHR